jgi:hypothetical protein
MQTFTLLFSFFGLATTGDSRVKVPIILAGRLL